MNYLIIPGGMDRPHTSKKEEQCSRHLWYANSIGSEDQNPQKIFKDLKLRDTCEF